MPSSTIGAVGPEVNTIDASALKSLEAINHRLEELTGKIHPTRYDAVSTIKLDLAREALAAGRASQAPLSGKESRS